MCISSPWTYGNTSPGGATPDLVLSQHSEHETTFTDLQGRRCCSWLAIVFHLTIIGLVVVEKVCAGNQSFPEQKDKID